MATTAFLIPGEGLIVRDPRTKDPLPAEGQIKTLIGPEGRYWRRRIKDRTVALVPTKKQRTVAAPSKNSVYDKIEKGGPK